MENFEKEKTDGKERIVLFYAGWCPFCRAFKPVFEDYEKQNGLSFLEADISDESDPLWDEYEINVIPTVLSVKDGKAVRRLDGRARIGLAKEDLASFMES